MSSTSQALLSTLSGKDPFGTGSHIFAAVFAATTFTMHVVQSYLFTAVANVKHIPFPSPAPLPSPATPTTTRPLTPTRSSGFVESRADVSYISLGLLLVLIVILAGAGSILSRSKKSESTVTRNTPPREQEPEQDPPPNLPPQQDEGSSDDTEDREDSSDEEREDGAGDPEDKAEDEDNGEQENDDNSACVSDGSPGGEPDDPSGSSNVDDIPPRFEPDPMDVLALALLYIFIITHIVRYALRKYLPMKNAAERFFISVISIMPHALHKYFVLKTATKRLFTSSVSTMRHVFHEHFVLDTAAKRLFTPSVSTMRQVLHEHFVLDTAAKRLFTSAISIRTKVGECFEHALQHIDGRLSWIEDVGVLMAMDIADVGLWNGTRGIENVRASVASVIMVDELREADTEPTLIEGLLVPISFDLVQIPKLPEAMIELPPLPLSTLEDMEPPSVLLPTLEAMEPPSVPTPALGVIEPPSLPLPTLEATEPLANQDETPSVEVETKNIFLRVVGRVIDGWSGVPLIAFIVHRIVVEWRQHRRGAVQIVQPAPKVEVKPKEVVVVVEEEEEEEEDEGNSYTAVWEHSSNDVTPDFLDAHGFKKEDDEEDGIEAYLYSDILDNSFATAQEISFTIDPAELTQEARPVLPTITVSPSFDVPNTPERVFTYPIGTPSFVDVLTSSTRRSEGTESRSPTSPGIAVFLRAPETPEPTTTYPSGTPSFADVLTSSARRPARTHEIESELSPGPLFSHFAYSFQDPTNAPSFGDVSTPFTFSVEYPRQHDTDTDNDNDNDTCTYTDTDADTDTNSREKMIQEVARMRALVVIAYASEDYDDDEIDRLTLLHLGVRGMEDDG
ncbi:hypothetical protein C0992_008376 [Termitomyces sp. T32_za158]|nr:hypothetical protein C0992_008376 [Termitomyces sp. T32_za158]